MFATIIELALKYLGDDLVKAIFGLIQSEMHDRGLIQQGREQQHADDLQASVTEAQHATQIRESVAGDSDAQLDAGLNAVRESTTRRP